MRIAICGPEKTGVISKIEKSLKTKSIKPWSENIIDYAAETYKHNGDANVIFDGSPFDFLGESKGEGYDEIYEQIAIDTVCNVDSIVVISKGMDDKVLESYKYYAELFKDTIHIYNTESEFSL